MNFVSFGFLFLFVAVLAARLTIGRSRCEPAYLAVVVLASTLFCAWDFPPYLIVLVLMTLVNFLAGRALGALARGSRRRTLVFWLAMGLSVAILGVFKYADFGVQLLQQGLAALGSHAILSPPDIIVPIGISFYTFQSMSYTIDVYRGQLAPLSSYKRFYFWVAFFPHFVSGPIVRGSEFLYQIGRVRRLNWRVFNQGAWLLIQGLFLKMVCADNLALFVSRHWGGLDANASVPLLAVCFFSCQIFADLAGYTSIARGLSYWLGFRLPENFNNPYIASTFAGFWQRWHITLSRWLRDYLFLPISYKAVRWIGRVRLLERVEVQAAYAAGALGTMLLGGLWHGAGFPFIVWGLLHGIGMSLERFLGLHRRPRALWRRILRAPWSVLVQLIILAAWVFFRSTTVHAGVFLLVRIFAGPFRPIPSDGWMTLLFASPIVLMHLYGWLRERRFVRPLGGYSKALLAAGMLVAILICYGTNNAFIYFQF